MAEYFTIILSVVLVNNYVLGRFLGLCPFIGVSKNTNSAVGMGFAVIFVMTMASAVTSLIHKYILMQYELEFLRTVVFILVIATLVQIVEIVLQKLIPPLYRALGIYLPLITTNCAVLGVSILNVNSFGDCPGLTMFFKSVFQGFFAGVGFMLAMILMASIRERLEQAHLPEWLKGAPIAFICASLMALSFMGFAGLG